MPEGDGAAAPQPVAASTRRVPIEHIVILWQENHTYDSLFADAEGGLGDTTIPLDTDPPAIAYKTTPTHGSWWSMRYSELNMYHSRLQRTQVPLLREWGDAYALCDTYHTEKDGPSDFNHASTAVGDTDVELPDGTRQAWIDNPQQWKLLQAAGRFFRNDPKLPPPITPPAVQQQIEEAGFSWINYGDSCFHNIGTVLPSGHALNKSPNMRSRGEFIADAREGKLPTVSWLAGGGKDNGGPPDAAHSGELWIAEQLQAIVDGGLWEKTAVFVSWDDSGGYYDHLPVPRLERMPQNQDRWQRLGRRVPCLVISPYAKPGYRSSEMGGLKSHRSLAKFVAEYLGLRPTDPKREAEVDSMWDCFNFDQVPLPAPVTQLTTPVPTRSFLQRVGAEVKRIPAKFEANVLMQEIATLYLLDSVFGPRNFVTTTARTMLGLDTPKTGKFSHQGMPSNPFGLIVYAPLALAGLLPGVIVDIAFTILIKMGIQGIPAPHAAIRERAYNRTLKGNEKAGFQAPPKEVDPAVWAASTPRVTATVPHPHLS